jgi:predicted TIM-barrel fold metal-dependent hydrolase
VCDFHIHLGYSSSQAASTPAETLASLRTAGFASGVVFPFERSEGIDYRAANDAVLDAAERWPELQPFARVDLTDIEASLDELRRVKERGAVGLKLHPLNDKIDPNAPETARLLDEVRQMGLPLILHSNRGGNSEPKQWLHHIQAMPDLRVILGHSGFFLWRDAMEVAHRNENVYLETSLAEAIICSQIAEFADFRRILFGSDHPYGDPAASYDRLSAALQRVDAANDVRRDVFSNNASRVLGRALPETAITAPDPETRTTAPAVITCRDREIPATAYDLFDFDCSVVLDEPSVDPADADGVRIQLAGQWHQTSARAVFGRDGRYALNFIDPPSELKVAIARYREEP